jgi:STE24 endopeptidase
LINKLSEKEIEAVLAHEVGHYKCGHIPTRLISSSIFLFAFFWVFSLSIDSSLFYISMGITLETLDTLGDNTVTYGAFLILFFYVLPFLLFPLKPLNSILSRKHEFEADRYAAKTSEPKNLISALIKLYRENSAPVITNRWFSLFYDSHPNAKARIEALE